MDEFVGIMSAWQGDLALMNPPTHADPQTQVRLAKGLRECVTFAEYAMVLIVVSRSGQMVENCYRGRDMGAGVSSDLLYGAQGLMSSFAQ